MSDPEPTDYDRLTILQLRRRARRQAVQLAEQADRIDELEARLAAVERSVRGDP